MKIIKTFLELKEQLLTLHSGNQTLGFVPTMGALHKGHLSLLQKSQKENSNSLVSIFVNPTQFNDIKDYNEYPVQLENDIEKLENAKCSFLFLPDVTEVYTKEEKKRVYFLTPLDEVLEGKFRPGHFQGVCQIIDKFLTFIQPNKLYLGQKDYQQYLVLKRMVKEKFPSIQIQLGDTIREESGLALSSRNLKLSKENQSLASELYKTLLSFKENFNKDRKKISNYYLASIQHLEKLNIKVEYLKLCNRETLKESENGNHLILLIAAVINGIRLIDNIYID